MLLKKDVDTTGVVPALWHYLGRIDELHHAFTGRELVVTDLWRGGLPGLSKHIPNLEGEVLAADLRRWYLDKIGHAVVFSRYLQAKFRNVIEVVLEPEWLTPAEIVARTGKDDLAPHIHIELVDLGFGTTK